MNLKCVITAFVALSTFSVQAEIDKEQNFKDSLTGEYVKVCSEEKGIFYVAGACGKYWKKSPRKREEIVAEVSTYKDIKRGSDVMIAVRKNGVAKWILGKVSFMYEDGSINVMEYYTNFGPTGGTTTWTIPYDRISKINPAAPMSSEKELCAKEDFEITYGQMDNRTYKFEKGERLTAHETYANNMIGVSFQGFAKNLFSYGMNNKLPVALNKLEVCPKDAVAVDDSKREAKDASIEIKSNEAANAIGIQK